MPTWLLKSRSVNNQGKCNHQIMLNVALTKSAILIPRRFDHFELRQYVCRVSF
jgi:hypothetical protein